MCAWHWVWQLCSQQACKTVYAEKGLPNQVFRQYFGVR